MGDFETKRKAFMESMQQEVDRNISDIANKIDFASKIDKELPENVSDEVKENLKNISAYIEEDIDL